MAKVTIEFDSVEEADDIRMALDGYKWQLVVHDMITLIRNTTKHDNSILGMIPPTEQEYEIAEAYRTKINDILSDYNLTI